jgi:hypothetical protein
MKPTIRRITRRSPQGSSRREGRAGSAGMMNFVTVIVGGKVAKHRNGGRSRSTQTTPVSSPQRAANDTSNVACELKLRNRDAGRR